MKQLEQFFQRFRISHHQSNVDFFKQWHSWYNSTMTRSVSETEETEFMQKARENYPYLPYPIRIRLHAILASYHGAHINYEMFSPDNTKRLSMWRILDNWVGHVIHPAGKMYGLLYTIRWHESEAIAYFGSKSKMEKFWNEHFKYIAGVRLDTDPHVSVLESLLVADDIDWRKYDLWIAEAQERDAKYLDGKINDLNGNPLVDVPIAETDVEYVGWLRDQFARKLTERDID